ncbi:hypothetical protein AB6A40_006043 [Gnathostoma spinigerum]|uniref:Uncharacterized protein n=1 Tax=Gnathostoma spinigerum TaxID=75299 RepID=A0ABD6EH81_9BILA
MADERQGTEQLEYFRPRRNGDKARVMMDVLDVSSYLLTVSFMEKRKQVLVPMVSLQSLVMISRRKLHYAVLKLRGVTKCSAVQGLCVTSEGTCNIFKYFCVSKFSSKCNI